MWGEENGKGKEEMGNLLGNPIRGRNLNSVPKQLSLYYG